MGSHHTYMVAGKRRNEYHVQVESCSKRPHELGDVFTFTTTNGRRRRAFVVRLGCSNVTRVERENKRVGTCSRGSHVVDYMRYTGGQATNANSLGLVR